LATAIEKDFAETEWLVQTIIPNFVRTALKYQGKQIGSKAQNFLKTED
jgi:hypothetical protein